jgi:hypothetical protein
MESRTVFFPGEISLFIDKEIGIFSDFFLILVQIQLILLIFLVKFCQIFNMKKMKKKKTLESRVSFKDFMM